MATSKSSTYWVTNFFSMGILSHDASDATNIKNTLYFFYVFPNRQDVGVFCFVLFCWIKLYSVRIWTKKKKFTHIHKHTWQSTKSRWLDLLIKRVFFSHWKSLGTQKESERKGKERREVRERDRGNLCLKYCVLYIDLYGDRDGESRPW